MGVKTDIIRGFCLALEAANIAPVAWPNVDYDGKTKPYLRVSVLPAPTMALGVTTSDIHHGLYQVDVVVTAGDGALQPASLEDAVIAAFPRNRQIIENTTKIRFTKTGYAGPSMQSGSEFFTPLSIPYKVYR